ncbi:Endonuclease/Exonuclease/phosphatase family protein [Babesia bovis T2Bo]|uniref:Endonuclease/exonuclease/phosphatase family protein n=1 Tax=Babesia bovis TaxID=5865 RepID=A7ASI9_BABBO|nr:Endonuclease/Exonuclease/phosphatase family protein [Babesia bovis T2Bo]EDO07508.1 Endonuclease/Exonuclease/phosphatase family protein [Babesia bovis T2Bo]|eukprot:XP_001611076.1 endonuclease/exonuclease/phosphatase family protein [Babesia bovis T2Bo]
MLIRRNIGYHSWSNTFTHVVIGYVVYFSLFTSVIYGKDPDGIVREDKRRRLEMPSGLDYDEKLPDSDVFRSVVAQICELIGCEDAQDLVFVEEQLVPFLQNLKHMRKTKVASRPPVSSATVMEDHDISISDNPRSWVDTSLTPPSLSEKLGFAHVQLDKSLTNDSFEFLPGYTEKDKLVVWCGTWNMNGVSLSNRDNIFEWISTGIKSEADVFVFFIQEFVPLTTANVLTSHKKNMRKKKLIALVSNILNDFAFGRGVRFVHLKSCSMVGLYLTVFVSEKLRPTVRDLVTTYVKTGFNGNVGNKGAVGIRFNMGGQNLAFVDVHLHAGIVEKGVRIAELKEVIHALFPSRKRLSILKEDLFVLGGDFNFRISDMMDYKTTDVFKNIYNGDYRQLLETDELILERKVPKSFFKRIIEEPITFRPTYKFGKETNFYDAERTPAWCDRILYGSKYSSDPKNPVRCMFYRSHDKVISSDHKPVSALFIVDAGRRLDQLG